MGRSRQSTQPRIPTTITHSAPDLIGSSQAEGFVYSLGTHQVSNPIPKKKIIIWNHIKSYPKQIKQWVQVGWWVRWNPHPLQHPALVKPVGFHLHLVWPWSNCVKTWPNSFEWHWIPERSCHSYFYCFFPPPYATFISWFSILLNIKKI